PACSVIVRFVLPGGRDRWAALKGRGLAPGSWIAGGRRRRMITKGTISIHLFIYGRCRASQEHAGALRRRGGCRADGRRQQASVASAPVPPPGAHIQQHIPAATSARSSTPSRDTANTDAPRSP